MLERIFNKYQYIIIFIILFSSSTIMGEDNSQLSQHCYDNGHMLHLIDKTLVTKIDSIDSVSDPEPDLDSIFQNQNETIEKNSASYVFSPIKEIINGMSNIVDFSVKHPKQAMVSLLIILAQYTAVSGFCDCYCENSSNAPILIGISDNVSRCKYICEREKM